MKLKGKLVTLLSAFCLVFAMLMVGVWALKTVDFKVDGNINFYTKGINATISKGVVSGGTYKNAEDEPNKMKEIKINTDKTMNELNQEFLSWRGVYLNFNSSGEDLTITFSITNDSETEGDLVKAVVYFDGATGDNATVSISSYNALLGPGESQEFVINFHIVDPTYDASVPSFDFSFDITDGSVGQDVVSYLTFEYDDATRTAKVIDCADWVTNAEIPEIVNNGIRSYTVTSIGGGSQSAGAFAGCSEMQSIVIPQTVSQIGSYAFYNCSSLERVDATSLSSWQAIDFGNEYSNPMYASTKESFYVNNEKTTSLNLSSINIDSYTYAGFDDLTELALADTVAVIETDAFKDCGNIETLVVGKGLSSGITASMFGGCASLKNLTTSSNIANNGFKNITTLQDVKLKNGVTSVGESGFSGCNALTQIEIAESVAKFNTNAFDGCSLLKSANYIGDLDSWLSITYVGSKSTPLYASGSLYFNGQLLENVVIDTATKIGAYAFYHVTSIKTLEIGNQVTSIGSQAFNGCSSIDGTITIPEGIKQIPSCAFASCSRMDSVSLPSTLTEIAQNAFAGSGLTEITLPANVASIGKLAFGNCPNLQTIICLPTEVPTMVETTALQSCTSLTAIYVPNESVDAYKQATNWSTYKDIIFGFTDADAEGYYLTFEYSDEVESASVMSSGETLTASVIDCSTDSSVVTSAIIPEVVLHDGKYYKVVEIAGGEYTGGSAFHACANLTSITIPNTITTIGKYAFSGCSKLTSINIPASVTSISSSLGYLCKELAEISVDANNTIYDSRNDCDAIIESSSHKLILGCKNTIIPETVTVINSSAFDGCTGLTSIAIPENVNSIGAWAFSGCRNLESISLPSSIAKIKQGTFNYCLKLKEVNISEGLTAIESIAFKGAQSLEKITLPITVNTIASSAFENCTALTTVVCFATNVLSLGSNVFANCSNLTAIYVPAESVTQYKEAENWINYAEIIQAMPTEIVDADAEGYYLQFEYSDEVESASVMSEGTELTATVIGNTISEDIDLVIPSVVLHNEKQYKVVRIAMYAFEYNTYIQSVVISEGIIDIEEFAFDCCENLKTIRFPSSLTTIGTYFECTSLESIDIPEGVTSILYGAFAECRSLKKAQLPSTLEEIEDEAFYGCTSLQSVNLPEGLKTIQEKAFAGCSMLNNLNLPSSLTNIGVCAFEACVALAEIVIPENTTVADYAFIRCSGLEVVVLPSTFVSIGLNAFWGCDKLSNSLIVEEGKTSIEDFEFANDNNLGANIDIPEGVISIGNSAFEGCNKILSVVVPSSVESIGDSVFKNCGGLISVFFNSTSAPTIGNSVFKNCIFLDAIYVPMDSVALYREAEGWSAYADLICGFTDIGSDSCYLAFDLDDEFGIATISGHTIAESLDLFIPAKVKNSDGRVYAVTAVGEYVFADCLYVTSLEVPNGVKSLERMAFSGCKNLKTVVLADTVTSLSGSLFSSCSTLEYIVIGKNLQYGGQYAFSDCTNLKTIVMRSEGFLTTLTASNKRDGLIENATTIYIEQSLVDKNLVTEYILTTYTEVEKIESGEYAGYTRYSMPAVAEV